MGRNEIGRYSIGRFSDGALVLSCGADGMASDLVFAEGATQGDPMLEKQRAILEHIVAALAAYEKAE